MMRARALRIDLPVVGPVPLSGAGIGATAQDVDGTLEANVLWLELAGAKPVLLVSVDALSAGMPLRNALLSSRFGFSDDQLGLFASHSHSAPALDPALPTLGAVDPRQLEKTAKAITDAIEHLSQTPQGDVTLSTGRAEFEETVYRRRKVVRLPRLRPEVTMMPDLSVQIDRSLRVAVLRDKAQAPVAVLWTLACHPTCYNKKSYISADYPGVVRDRIRKEYGMPELPVLFLQGCTGDIRPALFDQGKGWKRAIKNLIYGKTFGPVAHDAWLGWARRLSNSAIAAIRSASEPAATPRLRTRRDTIPLDVINSQPSDDRALFVHSFDLGGLRITGLSAEPSGGYADEKIWRVGYLDHTLAYLPTENQWREGGYEANGFRNNFSLPGEFRPEFEQITRQRLARTEAIYSDTP